MVQTTAFAIFPYPCIRIFEFTRLKLGRLPAYDQVLKIGRERKGAIFIDLGCCFGNDVRKAVQDGFPAENTLATDLRRGLWDLGHEMFKSTPQSFPTPFLASDILNPEFLIPVAPFTKAFPPTTIVPSLTSVTSLNVLHGHVSVLYMGAFFHLFSETQQEQIAHALAGLLSPEPESLVIGVHGGELTKGIWSPTGHAYEIFCHSPDSWKRLWEGKLAVTVFFDMYPGNRDPFHVMEWSVTRL
ncbi:hypothetical protein J3R30DRAFT_3659345 [Lentinula aciculospora]|uniref:Methyltransferase domain-containing protein n=1 Tax=Lentinula aciculospora TaxID=153920 RepID=A0A9W9DKB3_9AGAR|nr:hypothetical protein J3R30DRAFT_3659345 [Lentinula aciculospora]